ncbi:MAG: DUF1552 domain-containing protein [Polyangiaceae bacterium]|nr:DUF1552 domain-containing protein [Polyangiaceae bacterium]
MKKPTLSRRAVLRGALGGAAVAIGLPMLDVFLDSSGAALADGSPLPRRFGIFFWGNGVLPPQWNPATTGAGDEWQLSPLLLPLERHKKKLTVVSGMQVKTGNSVPHKSGPAGLLSGTTVQQGGDESFGGPTIDQTIAEQLGAPTRFRTLETAAWRGTGTLSYTGVHASNPAEFSPRGLFDRLFGDGFVEPGSSAKADPKIALRRSVLDAVGDDVGRLSSRLGKVDQARLDKHLSGIRQLEQQLQKLEENPPNLAACKAPAQPLDDYPDTDGRQPLAEVSRAMAAILAMSLACDQTRVFSHWFSYPVNNLLYPGVSAGHHQLTHDEPGDQPQVAKILGYVMTELAAFLDALDGVEEGDGTLLDHLVLLATSDVSYGRTHSLDDYPILLAGSCGGKLKTGLHYRSPASENAGKVIVSLARAMDVSLASFGSGDAKTSDSLSAIEAT